MQMTRFELIKPYLPASVVVMIDEIGLDATWLLLENFGGTRVYIQKNGFWEASRIRECLGDAAFEKLVAAYPGLMLNIPRCAKALQVLRDFSILQSHRGDRDKGIMPLDLNACARKFKMTERGVSKALRRIEKLEAVPAYRQLKGDGQVDLFALLTQL